MAAVPLALAVVALLAPLAQAQAVQDSRCYLMNGGAVESFFISEDTPVGSVIGTLSVNGDPSESGDITLRLQEAGAGVGVAPGTKNVTLLRPLDREEQRGPSNLYVNVRCDRRPNTDPSFIIPVSVRVWDVNDNAPVWVGAPYRVRLSELTTPGARVLHPRATDADQPGPHATIHYSVRPGPHSDYLGFLNELDSVIVVKKPLDYETLKNFTITLRAQDQGSPPLYNDTTLEVEVLDADDQNPKFTHEHYTAIIPDDAEPGTILETSPGPISAVDQDRGISAPLQYSATGDHRTMVIVDRDSGRVAATAELLQYQAPLTVVIKATQVDNPDRYALATLSLSRLATAAPLRPVKFTRRLYHASWPEDTPPGARLLTLNTDPPAATTTLQFYVSDRSFLEKFAINSAGDVLLRRPLDYETADAYNYQVMVTDGDTNDTASINITVLNVNEWEPRFRYPQYEFHVDGPLPNNPPDGPNRSDGPDDTGPLLPVGRLDVYDGDRPDTVALTLRGPDAGMLEVNELGEVFLRSGRLSALNSSVLHALATAQDSGSPPRQTSVPVLVHVGPRLLAAAGSSGAGGGRPTVVAAFACALAALALLVCGLLVYIYRAKRRSKAAAEVQNKSNTGFVSHEKPRSATIGPATNTGSGPGGGLTTTGAASGGLATAGSGLATAGGASGSLLSVSAGASTILANSTSSLDLRNDAAPVSGRQSQRFTNKSKVAPLSPGTDGGVSLMSDHLRAGSPGRSGVAWPAATIPARVKQLSWDHRPQVTRRGRDTYGRHQPGAGRPHEPHRLLLTTQHEPQENIPLQNLSTNRPTTDAPSQDTDQTSSNTRNDYAPVQKLPTNHQNNPNLSQNNDQPLNVTYPNLQNEHVAENLQNNYQNTPAPYEKKNRLLNETLPNRNNEYIPPQKLSTNHQNTPAPSHNNRFPDTNPNRQTEYAPQQNSHTNHQRNPAPSQSTYQLPDMAPNPQNVYHNTSSNRQLAPVQSDRLPNMTSPNLPNAENRNETNQRSNINFASPDSNIPTSRNKTPSDEIKSSKDSRKISPKATQHSNPDRIHFVSLTPNGVHPFAAANVPTNSRVPVEIIPIRVASPRHKSPVKKQMKAKAPKTPISVPMSMPEPIAYIPVKMNHPPLNPDFLPNSSKQHNKPRALKKLTPPGRSRTPLEYFSIPIIGYSGPDVIPYQTRLEPQSISNQTYMGVPYDRSPSAPRLSTTSQDVSLEGSQAFASIDPRKLRSHRVSPLTFNRTFQKYRML